MIPVIPSQRKALTNATKPFNDLNNYVEGEIALERELLKSSEQGQGDPQAALAWIKQTDEFSDLLNYTTAPVDKTTKAEKCVAILTHGVRDISTASDEMNAVAAKNTRVKAPAYHFILSWPEHERPDPEAIFDAAVHAIKALGLGEHQYIVAIHDNTDNMHAHISVNRVHPITFKSRNIEWAKKTLHKAARESEIKHEWTHDNGLWIVEQDGRGIKHVVINPEYNPAFETATHAHKEQGTETVLPTWHDPDSMESWLKRDVSKQLRKDIDRLQDWGGLHSWLSKRNLTLKDSGGGGLKLHGVAPDTGEIFTIAASKGLREIRRAALEKRWGAFNEGIEVPCQITDVSHLSPEQTQKGIINVLTRNTTSSGADRFGIPRPPEHIIRAQQHRAKHAAQRASGLHELPAGRVDGQGQDAGMLLPNAVHDSVGNTHAGQDQDVRRTGADATGGRSQRQLNRNDDQRQERKEQRALAREDLRQRFAQYKRFVQTGDTALVLRVAAIKSAKKQALAVARNRTRDAQKAVAATGRTPAQKFPAILEIDAAAVQEKLRIESDYQRLMNEVKITRLPALGWREWLYEQSNLGDKAAISALRGIVYQEGRDAKRGEGAVELTISPVLETDEEKYKKALARLLKQERQETAIRAANQYAMRPYEADVLLQKYKGMQWNVTGNGNVEYRASTGVHLFTDRGNRVTFDKDRVTDDEIRLALAHAQQKFGDKLMLTGDDPVFVARMARLADDMGLTVLNPEMRVVIEHHRATRTVAVEPIEVPAVTAAVPEPEAEQLPATPQTPEQPPGEQL